MTLQAMFAFQKQIKDQHFPNIPDGDNPEFFYHAINGIIREAIEAGNEDTRYWKAELRGKAGGDSNYKYKYNREAKINELADVFREWINACLHSGISADEMIEAIANQFQSKLTG